VVIPVAEPLPQAVATSPPNRARDLVLVGTVAKIVLRSEPELTPWAVTVRVERIVAGALSEATFSFLVHSPAKSGLEIGKSYTIKATWTDKGYVVDETQWRRP
jgi:hypothetical protein